MKCPAFSDLKFHAHSVMTGGLHVESAAEDSAMKHRDGLQARLVPIIFAVKRNM